jgi:energy-coupling factor transport system substrate-specific component
MNLIRSIKKDFNTMTLVLIPVAIAINVVIGEIVVVLKLPVFLDSIGTVLVGVLCGPWAGALTGTLSNTIWGLLIDPSAFPWFPVALLIGFVAGWCARFGLFQSWWKVVISGILISLTSATASTPISVYLYGGITASGSSFITAFLLQTGHGLLSSVLSTNFLVEPVDKITTALLAFAIIQGLSVRYVARFPRSENVMAEKEGTHNNTQIIVAIAIAAVLIVIAATVLVSLLAS